MKRLGWWLLLVTAAVALAALGGSWLAQGAVEGDTVPVADAQLRAMSDELARSRTLELADLDKPYFIQYAASDTHEVIIAASLGGVTAFQQIHVRQPAAEVRVGDYRFDNTNSIFSRSGRVGGFPLDDDYGAMRNVWWRTTDVLYKTASDQITRKRNALREIADPDHTPDLAPAPAVHVLEPPIQPDIDAPEWRSIVGQVSGRFAAHPAVTESSIRLLSIASTYRLVNSEGTMIRIPENLSSIEMRASAVASDGNRVWDHWMFAGIEPSPGVSRQEVSAAADALAAETESLAKAPLAEDYSGPVLFEKEAAAQMMAQVLTDALTLRRKPVAPPEARESRGGLESVWASRLASKVLPEWLSLRDDPLEKKVGSTALAGHYQVDDEGVRAEKVELVQAGTLKNFLLSREPVRTFNRSNGHGRLPGAYGGETAVIGNLFVEPAKSLSEAQLKARLLEKVKTAGLKYGVLVRSLDFPSTAPLAELQNLAQQLETSGYARTLTPPLLAYRVYPDGREELVRGFRFREFSAKDLRDIDSAANEPFVLDYVNNGSGFNIANTGSDITASSVVCPSLLVEGVDLVRAEGEAGSRPVVPAPELVRSSLKGAGK